MAGEKPLKRRREHQRIPPEINRDHVILALKEIDEKHWDKENDSIKYDLIFNGKRYPPKIVVKYANKYANGELFDVSKFSGGEDTTNKFFRALEFEIDFKSKASKNLLLNNIYSRQDLKGQFNISDASINNGIFKPKEFSSVWLFVTENKTPDRVQYNDYFDGDTLRFEGQLKKKTDHLLIEHLNDGNEIIVFYRKKKDEYPNYGFKYLGKFCYSSHSLADVEACPTRFILYPLDEDSEDKIKPERVAEKSRDYLPQKEGEEKTRIQTYYERKRDLRIKAIKIHGTKCNICGFDFGTKYGQLGEGYIEIHHIIPHASFMGEHEINPYTDLIPVCSNCHRMIHKQRDNWLTIDDMKKIIQ